MKYHTISRIRNTISFIWVLIVINIVGCIFYAGKLFSALNSIPIEVISTTGLTITMIIPIVLWGLTIIFLMSLAVALSAIEEHILYLRNHVESDK